MIIILLCPIASCFVSSGTASIMVMSYTGLGRDRMTPSRFFLTGWMSTLISNYVTVTAGLRWALPVEVGGPWVEVIGVEQFNFMTMMVAPTLAYAGGVAAVILTERVIAAQER
jgi:hypothetical protein